MTHAARGRRGFTLVETLIAMLVTSLLVLSVFGGLSFVGRGYRRDELHMARSRAAQDIFDQLAVDLATLHGTAAPTQHMLHEVGYEGTPSTFVAEPRRGAHVVAEFQQDVARENGLHTMRYDERAAGGAADWNIAPLACRYIAGNDLKPSPSPWGLTKSAFVVPLPPNDPDVIHVALAVREGLRTVPILWSFYRKKRNHFEAGTILREEGGARPRAFAAALLADISLQNEWVYLKTNKSTTLEPLELYLRVELKDAADPNLPFADPPFIARRVLTAGL